MIPLKITTNYIEPGTNNAVCMVCGDQHKGSELLRRWDNAIVCPACWEPRHPQDTPRIPRTERNRVTFTRPEPDNHFLGTNDATTEKL